jgi:hypothetical protein
VAFPGTGHPPSNGYVGARPVTGNGIGAVSLAGGGYPGGVGRVGPNPVRRRNSRPYVYAYPVYVPLYPEQPLAQEPAPTNLDGYSGPAPSPTVVINNYPAPAYAQGEPQQQADDTIHSYSGSAHPPAASDPQYYLIALKDHTIYSAVAYWVEDGTLHYVTSPNMHNQTSLDLVDAGLTAKLNEDRGVPVTLGPAH